MCNSMSPSSSAVLAREAEVLALIDACLMAASLEKAILPFVPEPIRLAAFAELLSHLKRRCDELSR